MRPRTIQINPVLNGFVVNVGCQTVVIKSVDELATKIAEYYKDPSRVEKLEIERRVNNTHEEHVPEPCGAAQDNVRSPEVPREYPVRNY